MTQPAAAGTDPVQVRHVSQVETLKALSDPTRLAILRVLMHDARRRPPVRSVKELAAELGEPSTKLYRHIKQLEACGLIEVVETRLVSGILEHRYRTAQVSLHLDAGLLGAEVEPEEILAIDVASMDNFRNEYAAAVTAGKIRFRRTKKRDPAALNPMVAVAQGRMTAERAAELRERMAALINDYLNGDDAETGVQVRILAAFYSPSD